MIMTQPLTHQHKDSFIMIASSPLRAIAARNAPNSVYRDMRDKAPYLYPEFVAGPFRLFELAADYADQLVVGRRGLPSKVRHACALARDVNVPCYHIAKRPLRGFDSFLRECRAPVAYIDAATRIRAAIRDLRDYVNDKDNGDLRLGDAFVDDDDDDDDDSLSDPMEIALDSPDAFANRI